MVKIIKNTDMATQLIKVPDRLQVSYKENTSPCLEFWIAEDDNKLIIQEPSDPEDLTKFFMEVSLEDWLKIKHFVDRHLNR